MSATRTMMIAGIVLILGGVFALLAPLAVSIAITLIVGVSFLVGGLFNTWAALRGAEDRVAHGMFAVLGLILGISFIADPLGGVISLTVLAGLLFVLSGAIRLWLAWQRRDHPAFWMLLVSGALSVVLGAVIFADIGATTGILGILLGVELVFAGIGLVTLSRMSR